MWATIVGYKSGSKISGEVREWIGPAECIIVTPSGGRLRGRLLESFNRRAEQARPIARIPIPGTRFTGGKK